MCNERFEITDNLGRTNGDQQWYQLGWEQNHTWVELSGTWKRHVDQMMKWNGSAFQEEETQEIEPYVQTGSTNREIKWRMHCQGQEGRRTRVMAGSLHEEAGTSDRALVMPQGRPEGTGVEQAETGVEQAETGVEQAETGVEQAETGVEQAETGVEQAETGVEQAETGVEQAETGVEQAETGVEQAETGVEQAETGVEQAETGVEQAETGVEQAETGVEQAETRGKTSWTQCSTPQPFTSIGSTSPTGGGFGRQEFRTNGGGGGD